MGNKFSPLCYRTVQVIIRLLQIWVHLHPVPMRKQTTGWCWMILLCMRDIVKYLSTLVTLMLEYYRHNWNVEFMNYGWLSEQLSSSSKALWWKQEIHVFILSLCLMLWISFLKLKLFLFSDIFLPMRLYVTWAHRDQWLHHPFIHWQAAIWWVPSMARGRRQPGECENHWLMPLQLLSCANPTFRNDWEIHPNHLWVWSQSLWR